jgi:non-specific protein-tyrosine kinase
MWIIIVTLLVTMIVVIVGTFLTTPMYTATAVIRIATAAGSTGNYTDYMYADRIMNTYVQSVTSTPVLDGLKLHFNIQELPQIKAEIIPSTELIKITVGATDPNFAADLANYLCNYLISKSETLYSGGGKSPVEILNEQLNQLSGELAIARSDYQNLLLNSPQATEQLSALNQSITLKQEMYATVLDQYEQARVREALRANTISVFEPAEVPLAPSSPKKILNIALGLIVGLIGGLGLAFLFENLDTTLYTTDQIEAITKLPSIGKIPKLERNNSFHDMYNNFAYGESFRRLRTNILSVDFPMKILLITSAEPSEGKSRILANLVYTMAQSGRNVIVVDCDLRVPTQHKLFNIDNKVGLSCVLEQKVTFKEAIQSCEFHGVHILPSGPLPINPSELLGSDPMKILINQLAHIFDLVIIDAPAVLSVADAAVLAPLVDAIALVIYRGKTSARAVLSAQAQLSKIKARWIGVIVNRAEMNDNNYYYNRKKETKINNSGTT